MEKMMSAMHAPGYSGDPNVDFLAMMIPHHQGAIDMARLALIHANDALTRRIAEDMIASQTTEIAAMTARLVLLRSGPRTEADSYPALGGLRGDRMDETGSEKAKAPGESEMKPHQH